ncbi:MAG: DUF2142 domain-containing protein [Lachnospiraceae bacterium]|nr:DUF2142 domain-containing protein [Lachnospiraceae bacterium]
MSSKKKIPESIFDDNNKFKLIAYNFIFFAILAIILVNSLNMSGYSAGFADPAESVVSVNGYTTDETGYVYQESEDCYIVLGNADNTGALYFLTDRTYDQDIEITVNYLNGKSELTNKENKTVWKKGTTMVDIPVVNGKISGYVLHIPVGFNITELCYGIKGESKSKVGWYVGMLFLALIISALIVYIKKIRALEEKLISSVLNTFKTISENKKGLITAVIVIPATFVSGILITFICKQAGVLTFNIKTVTLILCLLYIVDLFIFARKQFIKKFEVVGTVIFLLVGTTFVIIEPTALGVSLDDETHYKNVMYVVHAIDKRASLADSKLLGDQVTVALDKTHYEGSDQRNFVNTLNTVEKNNFYYDISGEIVHTYVQVAYIPSAFGFCFAKGLNLPFNVCFKFGKFFNILFIAILLYFSMRKLKNGKLILLLVFLIPVNIYMAASYSYDHWIVAFGMLGFSYFFGERQRPDEKMSLTSKIVICASLLISIIPKPVYFPLTFIALFISDSKFNSKKEAWIYRAFVMLMAFAPLIFLLSNYIMPKSSEVVGDTRATGDINPGAQIQYVKDNISIASNMFINFLKVYLNPYTEVTNYMNLMLYNGYLNVPKWIVPTVVILGSLFSRDEEEPSKFPWWFRLGVIFEYVLIGFIVAFSMYAMFTAVGSPEIGGCQGRYMLPVLFPFLYVLTRIPAKLKFMNNTVQTIVNMLFPSIIIVLEVYYLWVNCVKLY